jgi:hypothetical protein
VQKYFEDDAFVEWCKYLKYFSTPEYLPFLSYVVAFSFFLFSPNSAWRSLKAPRQTNTRADTLAPR